MPDGVDLSHPIAVPDKPALEGLEQKWTERWSDGRASTGSTAAAIARRSYSIDTPPPTVSGSLHVGHVFSYTHTDIIARFQRMRGQGRVLSHGLGRQRAADRAARAELLRRPLRSVAAVRPGVHAAGQTGEAGDPGLASELHRAVQPADRRRREGLRAPLASSRAVGGLVDDLRDDRPARPARLAARVPATGCKRDLAYQVEAPTLWDVDFRTAVAQAELEDREQPGAYHRIRFAKSSGGVRRDRDHASRADPGLRRARRAS